MPFPTRVPAAMHTACEFPASQVTLQEGADEWQRPDGSTLGSEHVVFGQPPAYAGTEAAEGIDGEHADAARPMSAAMTGRNEVLSFLSMCFSVCGVIMAASIGYHESW